MKKIFSALFLISLSTLLYAQDTVVVDLKKDSEIEIKKDENDTVPAVWKKGGSFRVNINQGSQSNWSAGGDKFSFSLNAYLNAYAFYKKDKKAWDNNLDLAYGIVQTTSLGRRKSNDRIEYTSKFGYEVNKSFNIAVLFNVRSQFANGYAYSKTPAGKDTTSLTSKSLTPTYFLQSAGIDWRPKNKVSIFISPVTARWVIVREPSLRLLYGVDTASSFRYQLGAFMSVNYNTKFAKKFTYKSKLDLFSNYKRNPQNIDVFWTNVITAKITKTINFSLNVDLIYDDDTRNIDPTKGPAPQILQLVGIGFVYNIKK